MPTASKPSEVQRVCRVCDHAVSKVGVMPSGRCGLHGCDERGWHFHCGQRHGVCTTAGCYPRESGPQPRLPDPGQREYTSRRPRADR